MAQRAPEPPTDLREACVAAAHAVIAEHGIEKLSLRDVARRLGVSHQAPYKHYASRDHLLAEVMRRCFQDFATFLGAGLGSADAGADMRRLGESYLAYASGHPLEYRLMFGTPWPDTAQHPDLLRDATHAFHVLRSAIARTRGRTGRPSAADERDALFVWSSMHGLASLLQSHVMAQLPLRRGVLRDAAPHTLRCVGAALDAGAAAEPAAPTAAARRAKTR